LPITLCHLSVGVSGAQSACVSAGFDMMCTLLMTRRFIYICLVAALNACNIKTISLHSVHWWLHKRLDPSCSKTC